MLLLLSALIHDADASGQIIVRSDRPCIVVVNMVPYPTSGGDITVTIDEGHEGDQNVRIRNLLGEQQWAGKILVPHDSRVLLKWELGYMNVEPPEPLRDHRPKLSDRGIVLGDGIPRNAPGDLRRPAPAPAPAIVAPPREDPFLEAVAQAGEEGGGGALPTEATPDAPAAGGTGGVKLANRTGSWSNVRIDGTLHEFRGELDKALSLPTGAHQVEIGDFRDKERWWTGELWIYPDFTVELQFSQAAAPAAINRQEALAGAGCPGAGAVILLLVACDGGQTLSVPTTPSSPAAPTNVLVLLTDDQGVDKVAAYGEHPSPPRTPRIDALAADGVLFRNAYATPICSPTRAALLTGRYGRRTGMGGVVQFEEGKELPLHEVMLPERLAEADPPYANAAVGKWHLGAFNGPSGVDHPNLSGFDRFAGSMGNLYDAHQPDGERFGYYHWERIEDGAVSVETRYATTVTVDDALDALATLPEPWFVYVAFNAPHRPLDAPPPELGTYGDLTGEQDDHVLHDAVVEALDTEIGRLLDSADPEVLARTTVFFLGDNGTEQRAIREPWDERRGKDTPFEAGANVPFIVTGPLVAEPGSESAALVHVVDLFRTIEALADLPDDGVERDGLSLLPLFADPDAAWPRDIVHTEKFEKSGPPPYRLDWRISRGDRFKWMELGDAPLLFDLQGRTDDGDPVDRALLSADEQAEVDGLVAEHAAFWASLSAPAAP